MNPVAIITSIASELGVRIHQVQATVELLDGGATVPFIARYRKEVTGGLDDTQLRNLEERLRYLRELEERREAVLSSIREQNKMTDELEAQILAADTKQRLEDLYLPYKQKRRTKGQIAREAGIEPLAQGLLADPSLDPEHEAAKFLNPEAGFADVKSVLEGARYVLMEQFAEDADLIGTLRKTLWTQGFAVAKVVQGKEEEGAKFSDYFDFSEKLEKIPSHRALALFRAANEEVIRLDMAENAALLQDPEQASPSEAAIASRFGVRNLGRPADPFLEKAVQWTWRVKLQPSLKLDLLGQIREAAEEEAIKVFGKNLHDLLMAPPAGAKATMGLDPGLRTGVKVAVVDDTGKLVDHLAVFPHVPLNRWDEAILVLARLCEKHKVKLIAIGNGTASRETERLAKELLLKFPEIGATAVVVSEAGASVYSASELAAKEFPDLDVSYRGAVSIARRLQDPLAELVKIEPKSIGVGQYQHDVNQTLLAQNLDAVVETCVNAVGVDLNMASAPLLTHVSGLSSTLAQNIVAYRNEHGRFRRRQELLKVPRLGPKAFEQAAGFLKIPDGDSPLDRSSVHPEAYPVVERIAARLGKKVGELIGSAEIVRGLNPAEFTDERFGIPTVSDILAELEKPGRDPRPEFRTARFAEGIERVEDLAPGMVLEGTVTNVTNFGAFVDVGVHQDGLVHVSALSHRFVKDPREVVKTGDIVKVKVIEVDQKRKRIALSMKLDDAPAAAPTREQARTSGKGPTSPSGKPAPSKDRGQPSTAFGSLLGKAIKR